MIWIDQYRTAVVDPVPTDVPEFLNVASGVGLAAGLVSSTLTGQARALAVVCNTRFSAATANSFYETVDGYSTAGSSAGLDGGGAGAGAAALGATFGTRSQIEWRQDWLNFLAGDEYEANGTQGDINLSVGFYKVPYPWRVRQVAHGSTATTALSATFASPCASGCRVLIAVATLEAVTVTVDPAGFALDGSHGLTGNRTSRITTYRSQATNLVGATTRSVTLSASTGGAAMTMIEFEQGDVLETALPTAIRASTDLRAYYPMQHTLGTIEKQDTGAEGLANLTTFGNWSMYAVAGTDGRSYAQHVTATNGSTLADKVQYTPNGNGGLTIGFLARLDSLATAQTFIAKYVVNAFNREWTIDVATDGTLSASTYDLASGAVARARASAAGLLTTGVWYSIQVRFGNGAADFPKIRVNGTDVTGTTSGTTNANADTASVVIVGARVSTTNAYRGAMGHLFFIGTDVADSVLDTLDTAAQADGWF
jgi:hypothetical protein